MEKSVNLGSVVFSVAGRDKGSFYVVSEIVDDDYILMVDGRTRRLDNPKRKKLKHLKNTGDTVLSLGEKFSSGAKVYDAEVFSALRRYNS